MPDETPSALNIHFDHHDDIVLARLAGVLGTVDAPALTDALADHAFGENARLAIDLSALRTLDSSGLSALINVVTRARMTGGRVVLVSPSTFVSGVLAVTHLDKWFDICDSTDEAALRLNQP